MAIIYAAGRDTLEVADWSIAVTNDGNLSANTYYFSIQARNRIGKTYPLEYGSLAVVNGDKITFTINSTARATGEGWISYIIGFSTTNDILTFQQLAEIPILDPTDDYQTFLGFPLTLEVSEDSQLIEQNIVANETLFPSTNLINGQLVGLTSTGFIYFYDEYDTTTTTDGLLVFSASPVGRWKFIGTWFNINLPSIEGSGGAKQDLRDVEDASITRIPDYNLDGNASPPVDFWLTNDSGASVPTGTRIATTIKVGTETKTQLFDQKLRITFLGFVDQTTGVLRTTYLFDGITPLENVGVEEIYDVNENNVFLLDECQSTEAVVLSVSIVLDKNEFLGLLTDNAYLRILPYFSASVSVYTNVGDIFGSGLIFNKADFRRVVPGTGLTLTALEGSGIVQSYTFPVLNTQLVAGLQIDTGSQKVLINRQGVVYYSAAVTPPSDSVQRALVSTLQGESIATAFTAYETAVLNDQLEIELTYPSDADGLGTIRSNYPDVIAGNSKGNFNAEKARIYVQRQSDSEIRYFDFTVIPDVTQDVIISDFTAGTVIGSVPIVEYGLYTPVSNTLVVNGGGSLAADDYRVAYSLIYEGNSVTDIDHSVTSGNITEQTAPFEDIFNLLNYFCIPVTDLTALSNIPAANLFDGLLCNVLSIDALYTYDSGSVAVPDGNLIVDAVNGSGNFLKETRQNITELDDVVNLINNSHLIRDGSGNVTSIKHNLTATAPPTATDDNTQGYGLSSVWVDNTSKDIYFCVDATTAAALWDSTTTGGSIGHVIQEEGGNLPNRANLNFIGDLITAADDAGNNATTVTLDSSDIMRKSTYDVGDDGVVDLAADSEQLDGELPAFYLLRSNHSGTLLSGVISDLPDQNTRVAVQNNGVPIGTRRAINFVPSPTITYNITDSAGSERVNISIDAAASGGIDEIQVRKQIFLMG